jgi:hypothetical protein
MTEIIASVLGTAAWFGGVLVLVLMAAVPLLEWLGDAEWGR